MKKTLIAAMLILCMVFSLAACGGGSGAKVDIPEKNIDHLVNTFNTDINVKEMLSNIQTTAPAAVPELEVKVDDISGGLLDLQGEISVDANVNGQSIDCLVSMKDGTGYANLTNMFEGYVFFEDDLTMTAVMNDGMGGYVGMSDGTVRDIFAQLKAVADNGTLGIEELMNVIAGLALGEDLEGAFDEDLIGIIGGMESGESADALAMLLGGSLDEFLEENEELVEMLNSLELPELTEDMIEYKDGKYFVDNAYIVALVNSLLDFSMKMSGGYIPSTQLDATKAAVAEYVKAFNLTLYFYVEYEQISGIGLIVAPEADILNMLGAESLNLLLDINSKSFDVHLEASISGSYYLVNAHGEGVVNEAGELEKGSVAVQFSIPQATYVDGYDGDVMCDNYFTLNAVMDATKYQAGGEMLSVEASFMQKNFVGYTWNMSSFEYAQDPEFVDVYSKDAPKFDLSLKAVSADGGNKVTVDLDLETKNAWQMGMDEDIDVDVVVAISTTANRFPDIPKAVKDAKADALARLN